MLSTLSDAAQAGSAVIDWPAFISGAVKVLGAALLYFL